MSDAETLRRAVESMRSDLVSSARPVDFASYPAFVVAVASMLHEIDCAHYPMDVEKHLDPYGCATCWPNDGAWPCGIYDEALVVAHAYLNDQETP